MTAEPIYDTLIAGLTGDTETARQRATAVLERLSHYPASQDPPEPPETAVNVLDTIRTDFENALTAHGPEIEAALGTAAQVAASPAAQTVLAVVTAGHVPASILDDFARQLTNLDSEFAKLTPVPAAEPEPAQ